MWYNVILLGPFWLDRLLTPGGWDQSTHTYGRTMRTVRTPSWHFIVLGVSCVSPCFDLDRTRTPSHTSHLPLTAPPHSPSNEAPPTLTHRVESRTGCWSHAVSVQCNVGLLAGNKPASNKRRCSNKCRINFVMRSCSKSRKQKLQPKGPSFLSPTVSRLVSPYPLFSNEGPSTLFRPVTRLNLSCKL